MLKILVPVQFAVAEFGFEFVGVLTNTNWGANDAAHQDINQPSKYLSSSLRLIADDIEPSVRPLMGEIKEFDQGSLTRKAACADVRRSTRRLYQSLSIPGAAVSDGKFVTVRSEYVLQFGTDEFVNGIAQ